MMFQWYRELLFAYRVFGIVLNFDDILMLCSWLYEVKQLFMQIVLIFFFFAMKENFAYCCSGGCLPQQSFGPPP